MSEIIQGISSPALVAALETNMCEFYKPWGRTPQTQLWEDASLIQVVSDMPFALLNGIFQARLVPERVDATIQTTIARLALRQVPGLWWMGPATQPPDLGRHLEGHGFVHTGDVPGMAVDLLALEEDLPFLRRVDAVDTVEQGRFSRSIGADQPQDLSLRQIECGVRQGLQAAKALGHILKLKDWLFAHTSTLRRRGN